jgi:hypothetical protein
MAPRKSTTAKRRSPQAKAAFIESMECLPVTKLPDGLGWTDEIKLHRLAAGVWTLSLSQENTSLEA